MRLKWWHIGLFLCLVVAGLSPLASGSPDGLERVAEDEGFIEKAREAIFEIIPDYVFPWVGNETIATILAGLVGTLLLFGLVYGIGLFLKRRKAHPS
jgi:hypothetical protein